MKTYLILINNAPKMGVYHKGLGDELKKKGNKVIYAFTDRVPIITYNIPLEDEVYYVFSEYFAENETLSILSDKYKNVNWWKTFFPDYDRMIVHFKTKTYEKRYYENLITNLVCFFDLIVNNHQPDFFIYENISNSFAYVCYEVCRINNVKYRGYVSSRLPNRFELHTEEFGIKDRFKVIFNKINFHNLDIDEQKEIEIYLQKYSGDEMPSYHPKNSPLTANYSLFKRYINNDKRKLLEGAIKFNKNNKLPAKYSYQVLNPMTTYLSLVKRQFIKKARTWFGKNMFDSVVEGEKYFLYPLHMKPESSTSVLARHYCDDLAVIRNIAFNIPFGYKLYVKEHFVNYGNFPFSFYKELKKIPNVRLIHSGSNTINLIRNCTALITLTSTMGFEALLMNKNVIIFGNVFYECHPNCLKLTNFEDLHNVLLHLKIHDNTTMINKHFIAAYREITYEGNMIFFFYPKKDIAKFSLPLIKAIETYDGI